MSCGLSKSDCLPLVLQKLLELQPKTIHDRTGVVLGSREEVERFLKVKLFRIFARLFLTVDAQHLPK
jgi:hypothetical protein